MANDTPPKAPISPFKLTSGRIILLLLGALLLSYVIAALSGSLTNYQMVKEAAQDARAQQQAPAADTTPATPAPTN